MHRIRHDYTDYTIMISRISLRWWGVRSSNAVRLLLKSAGDPGAALHMGDWHGEKRPRRWEQIMSADNLRKHFFLEQF